MGEDTVRILSPMLLMMANRPSNDDKLMGNRAPLTGHEFWHEWVLQQRVHITRKYYLVQEFQQLLEQIVAL